MTQIHFKRWPRCYKPLLEELPTTCLVSGCYKSAHVGSVYCAHHQQQRRATVRDMAVTSRAFDPVGRHGQAVVR